MAQVDRPTLKGYGDAGDILTNAQWINICDSFALVSELGGGGGGGGVSHVLQSVSTISARTSYSGNAPTLTEDTTSNQWRLTADSSSVIVSSDFDIDVADLNASNELVIFLKSDAGHIWRPKGITIIDKTTKQKFSDNTLDANGVSILVDISDTGEIQITVTNANVFTNGIYFAFSV